MFKKVIAIFVILSFIFVDFTFDFLLIKEFSKAFPVRTSNIDILGIKEAFAGNTPYCPPDSNGRVGVFNPNIGYCTLTPLDDRGTCNSPYIYSTDNRSCIVNPLCPGTSVWDAEFKACLNVSYTPSNDTEVTLPDHFCMADLNNDGDIQPNEINNCLQSNQGYVCPIGLTACEPFSATFSCPTGYTYNSQRKVCEAYTAPAVCTPQQLTETWYQCPINGELYETSQQCTNNCKQTALCKDTGMIPITSGGGLITVDLVSINCSGNSCIWRDSGGRQITLTVQGCSLSGNTTFRGAYHTASIGANGSTITIRLTYCAGSSDDWCIDRDDVGYIYVNNCYVTGGLWVSGFPFPYGNIYLTPYENAFLTGTYGSISFNYPDSVRYTCPLGNYPCAGSPLSCTESKQCDVKNRPKTQWKCSIDNKTYSTDYDCNSSCTVTCPSGGKYNADTGMCEVAPTVGSSSGGPGSICSSQQSTVTQYQCPVDGKIYNTSQQCADNCKQTALCNTTTPRASGGGRLAGYYRFIDCYGNTCYFYRSYGYFMQGYYDRLTVEGCSFSGYLGHQSYDVLTFTGMGSVIRVDYVEYGYGDGGRDYYGTFYINVYNCNVTGSIEIYSSGTVYPSGNSFWVRYNYGGPRGPLTFNYLPGSAPYVCPLGNYPCTGSPPSCSVDRQCTSQSSTITQWQCSADGSTYSTEQECNSSCPGKYTCPLGDYPCQLVNGVPVCSKYQCGTSNNVQDDEGDIIPFGYEDDGTYDENDVCLGTIYIFNGKGMRCRKSGVQTGFHNCCNESKGKLYDSTGSFGASIGKIIDIAKIMHGVYKAISLAHMGARIASSGGLIVVDRVANTISVGLAGKVTTYSMTEGNALINGLVSSTNHTVEDILGNVAYRFPGGGDANAAAGSVMAEYSLLTSIAPSVVSLATSLIIKDPVLSSSVNVVAQAILWYAQIGGWFPFASAVAGLVLSLFMARCDKQDVITSTFKDSGYCHEVGEYCVKKWPLIGCVQRAKSFCCFNSKLARIIHEQGRPQLYSFLSVGVWGSAKNPYCRGFTPEEFQALDFNRIDLSEYIQDIQRNIRQNIEPQLRQEVEQRWGR